MDFNCTSADADAGSTVISRLLLLLAPVLGFVLMSYLLYVFNNRQIVIMLDDDSHTGPKWSNARLFNKSEEEETNSWLSDGLLGLKVLGDSVRRFRNSTRSRRLFGCWRPNYYVVVPCPSKRQPVNPADNEMRQAFIRATGRIQRCLGYRTTVLFVDLVGDGVECRDTGQQIVLSPIYQVEDFQSLNRTFVDLLVLLPGRHVTSYLVGRLLQNCSGIGNLVAMEADHRFSYDSDEIYQDALENDVIKVLNEDGTVFDNVLPCEPERTFLFNSGIEHTVCFYLSHQQESCVLDKPIQTYEIAADETNACRYFPALMFPGCYEDVVHDCTKEIGRHLSFNKIYSFLDNDADPQEQEFMAGLFTEHADTVVSRHVGPLAFAAAVINWQTDSFTRLSSLWSDPLWNAEEGEEPEKQVAQKDDLHFHHCFRTNQRVSSTQVLNVYDVRLVEGGSQILKERLFPFKCS